MGDKCTCSKKGHNNCVIVEGDPNWVIDGRPVALEGHKTSCGAVLISSAPNAGREESGGAAVGFSQTAGDTSGLVAEHRDAYDEQVHLNADGRPTLTGLPYYVETPDGRTFSGYADELGLVPRIDTDGE